MKGTLLISLEQANHRERKREGQRARESKREREKGNEGEEESPTLQNRF